jgi:2',3'-cyclic-nucleotide 2'-phosphodiesterase (5'-nucleotidase family)
MRFRGKKSRLIITLLTASNLVAGIAFGQGQSDIQDKLKSLELTTDCPSGSVCATILHLNDVYEISAVRGGSRGGLDRVKGLKDLLSANPEAGPVITAIAGDFFSPSGMGMIKEQDRRWAGKQMVSTLKAIGLDLAVLGNHEFDLDWQDFKARLDESATIEENPLGQCQVSSTRQSFKQIHFLAASHDKHALWRDHYQNKDRKAQNASRLFSTENFDQNHLDSWKQDSLCLPDVYQGGMAAAKCFDYVQSNVFAGQGAIGNPADRQGADLTPFKAAGQSIQTSKVLKIKRGATEVHLGVIGLTIEKNQRDYQVFTDVEQTAKLQADHLKRQVGVDSILALTHINRADDIKLLEAVSDIDLSLGGHDHVNSFDCVGKRCVAKADANAVTVYVHRLIWDVKGKAPQLTVINSHLIDVDESIPSDSDVSALIDCWFNKADMLFKTANPDAKPLNSPIANLNDTPLDAREAAVRNPVGSNFTRFYTKAMVELSNPGLTPDSRSIDFALLNGGSIRLDDYIGPGFVTAYDVVKTLPFGGDLVTVLMPIDLFAGILKRSWVDTPIGAGGIVHLYPELTGIPLDKPNDITQEQIKASLIKVLNIDTETVKLILPAYLVTFGDDFSEEDKAQITILDEKLPLKPMQAMLQKAFETYYPL